jgi:hypothetical protein
MAQPLVRIASPTFLIHGQEDKEVQCGVLEAAEEAAVYLRARGAVGLGVWFSGEENDAGLPTISQDVVALRRLSDGLWRHDPDNLGGDARRGTK